MSQKKTLHPGRGVLFSFEVDGRTIEVCCSTFSGKEQVLVDGTLVSSKRSLAVQSVHLFDLGDDCFEIRLDTAHLFKGPFVCTLSKNGTAIRRQKLEFPALKRKSGLLFGSLRVLLYVVLFLFLFMMFLMAKAFWGWPSESDLLFFLLLLFGYAAFAVYLIGKRVAEAEVIDEEVT